MAMKSGFKMMLIASLRGCPEDHDALRELGPAGVIDEFLMPDHGCGNPEVDGLVADTMADVRANRAEAEAIVAGVLGMM